MSKITGSIRIGLLCFSVIVVVLPALVSLNMGQNYNVNNNATKSTYTSNLVLNIYVNDAGKVLVTGYADSIDGLAFLKDSQYKYDKDTKQLYALTNSLTYKSGEDWEAKLPSFGNYSEYHSIFYLPASVKISKIEATPGLEYLVSATNDSFQVDLHGYDTKSPIITIDYQLPITESGATMASNVTSMTSSASYLMPALSLFGLALASAAIFIWTRRKPATVALKYSRSNSPEIEKTKVENEKNDNIDEEASDKGTDDRALAEKNNSLDPKSDLKEIEYQLSDDNQSRDENTPVIVNNLDADNLSLDEDQTPDELIIPESKAPETANLAISITSEMAAVMETLTSRERAVLEALINHSGKMVQADIRYETRIPKSSLTGILLSLERRKLVTKKEMGRVNIIELSEWFLSKKGLQ